MGSDKLWLALLFLAPFAAAANTDCLQEERVALAEPGMRQDLKGLQLSDIEKRDTATLKPRMQAAEARAGSSPAAALYACLAKAELQRREGGSTMTTDDPKARGRSARVM